MCERAGRTRAGGGMLADEIWNVSNAPQRLTIAAVAAVLIAYAAAELAARFTRALLVRVLEGDATLRFTDPIVRTPIRAARAVLFVVALAFALGPVLAAAGVALPRGIADSPLFLWFSSAGLRVLVVGLVAYVVVRVAALAAAQWERRLEGPGGPSAAEQTKRARTLTSLVRNVVVTAVTSVAGLTILRDLGVDVMPVVTGAGILGLAVGFGAQTLVRDIISGFFLIFENHLRVGDVATIDGTGGIVEAINLRTTTLRDLEGVVHVFPNGSFERFSNRTKDYSYYVIDVGIAYKEDTDRVTSILHSVGGALERDPQFAEHILSPIEVLGVDAFEDSQVTLKTRIKTAPLKQWEVGRELRRRIKQAFDREGVEIPFPHLSVYFGEASRPWKIDTHAPG